MPHPCGAGSGAQSTPETRRVSGLLAGAPPPRCGLPLRSAPRVSQRAGGDRRSRCLFRGCRVTLASRAAEGGQPSATGKSRHVLSRRASEAEGPCVSLDSEALQLLELATGCSCRPRGPRMEGSRDCRASHPLEGCPCSLDVCHSPSAYPVSWCAHCSLTLPTPLKGLYF